MDKELTPEEQARLIIDQKLVDAGWTIQDKKRLNLYEGILQINNERLTQG